MVLSPARWLHAFVGQVSQDEMRCAWRTGRTRRGSFISITTWKDLQAWKTQEAEQRRMTARLRGGCLTRVRQDISPELHSDQKLWWSLQLVLQIRSHRGTNGSIMKPQFIGFCPMGTGVSKRVRRRLCTYQRSWGTPADFWRSKL